VADLAELLLCDASMCLLLLIG